MLFTSFAYLVFLPVVFGLYWLMGRSTRAQNWLLLVASYVFYGWWDAKLLLLILGMTAVTFGAAAVIGASRRPAIRRTVCGAAVVVCLGVLVVFKYFDFFARSMAEALRAFGMDCDMVTLRLILPAGISFYTFQSLSYVIDVYRGSMRPTRDFVCYAVFIAFFPQLVAGPIERASRMIPIFSSPRTFCYAQAVEGLRRILIGLLKKMVIADNISESVTAIFSGYQGQSSAVLAFGAWRDGKVHQIASAEANHMWVFRERRPCAGCVAEHHLLSVGAGCHQEAKQEGENGFHRGECYLIR